MATTDGVDRAQSKERKPCAARKPRVDGWTAARRKRFLETLEETGHVALAARAAGRPHTSTAYKLRYRDPGFAAEWDEAIERAKARIEGALMARALAAIEARTAALAPDASAEPLDFNQLLQLLKFYQAAPTARGRAGGPARRYATREETDAALMKKLDVVEAQIRARERKEAAARRAARAAAKEAAVKGQG